MKSVKKMIFVLIAVVAMAMVAVACNNGTNGNKNGDKQVPVYQGMTISDATIAAYNAYAIVPTAAGGTSGDSGNHYGWYKDKNIDQDKPFGEDNESIEDVISDSLKVTGSVDKIYYAAQNQDIFITIHINNPDSFEILSFTLNGKTYSSYMFESGSDMENLILKVNVGNVRGIIEYTIDAIKYIDGTEIKDVIIGGDQTVLVGVHVENQVTAQVTESIGFNDIALGVKITDLDELIEYSDGKLKAVVYDGEALVDGKDLAVGDNSVKFEGLKTGGLYEYAIVGYYDNLIDGFGMNVLYKKAVYTEDIVYFDKITVSKTSIEFDFTWHEKSPVNVIDEIVLLQNGKEQKIDIKDREIKDLLSDTEYTLVARYTNKGEKEEIKIDFRTLVMATPEVDVTTFKASMVGFDFEIAITDMDNVGAVTKIELINGNNVVEVDLLTRAFFDLLSDNEYTVRVTYTYDLNDGTGEHTIVKTASAHTLAKATPKVEVTTKDVTQTGFGFDIEVIDEDSVGAITKIELVHGEEAVEAKSLDMRAFDNLLSNNEYTVRVTYTYNLNDGTGEHTIVKTASAHTLAKATPKVEVTTKDITQTGFGFDVEVIDEDSVGAITKIELVHGEEAVEAKILDVRAFDNLLSNNEYTVRVTYTYDLNDGAGEHDIAKEASIKTLAKTMPEVEIKEGDVTQTSITFAINITDNDEVGEISKIELIHGDDVVEAENLDVRAFDNLLSNNEYTVRVTYTYDLNDGTGEHEIVKTASAHTLAKATPKVEIVDIDKSQTSISFDIIETDDDNIGEVSKIELLQGGEVKQTAGVTDRKFENLTPYTLYTVRLTYVYNLNDGKGDINSSLEKNIYTVPEFETISVECINSSAVSMGDKIVLQAKVNNPSKVTVNKVRVNGDWYPTVLSSIETIRAEITSEGQFAGGDTLLVIEAVDCTVDGNSFIIGLDANNTANCFVNGEIEVVRMTVVDGEFKKRDFAYSDESLYLLIIFNNPTGYEITSIYVDKTYTQKNICKIDNNAIFVKINKSAGKREFIITSFEYSNSSVGIKVKNLETQIFAQVQIMNRAKEEIVEIRTAEDLKNMNSNYSYKLMNDIDLKNIEWNSPADFRGYFDGNGFAIKNMRVIATFENKNVDLGLFNKATGVIKDLKIEDVLVIVTTNNGSINFGGIAVSAQSLILDGVTISGDVSANNIYGFGGFVTYINSSALLISNCESNLSLECEYPSDAGGFIGHVESDSMIKITNSVNKGNITGNETGGFIGFANGGAVIDIIDCHNTGNITGIESAGGIIGSGSGNITRCYNTGNIFANEIGGGLIGYGNNFIITDCYNTGNVSAYQAGGLAGSITETIIIRCYNIGYISGQEYIGGLISGGVVTISDSYYIAPNTKYDFAGSHSHGKLTLENCYHVSNGTQGIKKDSAEEIVAILKDIWDNSIWDFDTTVDGVNPTLRPTKDSKEEDSKEEYDDFISSLPVRKFTFEVNGGTPIASCEAKFLSELPTPVKEGYCFVGWYENAEFEGARARAPYFIDRDITLYAKWADISKQSKGLEIVDGVIVGIGTCKDSDIYISLPVASGAMIGVGGFKLYLLEGATSIGDYAFYNSSFTYIFISEGVREIGSKAFWSEWSACFVYCEAKSAPEGWAADIVNSYDITSIGWGYDLSVKTYTFVTNCDEVIEPIEAIYINSLPTLVRDGYVFLGWYTNPEFEGVSVEELCYWGDYGPYIRILYFGASKTTFYAKWAEA